MGFEYTHICIYMQDSVKYDLVRKKEGVQAMSKSISFLSSLFWCWLWADLTQFFFYFFFYLSHKYVYSTFTLPTPALFTKREIGTHHNDETIVQ